MGKIVLYAKHDVNIRKGFLDCAGRLNSKSNWPTVADIPHRESVIPKGAPICTVFANGKTTDEVLGNLSDAAKSVFEWLNE
jgi:predicted ATP-grasp superfamily ATP-dependent carboligase